MARIVITGASGLLGGNLAAELRAQGHDVIATRRAKTRIIHLEFRVSAGVSEPCGELALELVAIRQRLEYA
jgi:uncharacterized protein YbjT (DUF2867 family)